MSIDGTLVRGKLLVLVPLESPTGTEKKFWHVKEKINMICKDSPVRW